MNSKSESPSSGKIINTVRGRRAPGATVPELDPSAAEVPGQRAPFRRPGGAKGGSHPAAGSSTPDSERQDGRAHDGAAGKKPAYSPEGRRKSGPPSHMPARDFQNPGLNSADLKELKSLQSNFSALGISKSGLQNANDISAYRDVKWSSLGIRLEIVDILQQAGFLYPSPVQVLSIPYAIKSQDLLVRAKNGTGKSAAFIIPIINRINVTKGLQAVILVPIRELALQISKIFMIFGRQMGVKSVPLVGGTDMTDDIMRLTAGVHVVIGTPGRVLDILSKKVCPVESSPIIVFDEADKLLDSMFYSSISELLKIVPERRQMLLYSATFPHSIEGFVQRNMSNPRKIKVSEQNLQNVRQYFAKIKGATKLLCLKSLLTTLDIDQCIIYCNSRGNVKNLARKITALGMSTYFIYSDMAQEERNIVYHNFSNKKCRILVSTDITTRGIDAPGVNVVINFDMPSSSESYLHRVGRAGRFGTRGCAINLVEEEEAALLQMYERAIGMDILPISDPSFKGFCKK